MSAYPQKTKGKEEVKVRKTLTGFTLIFLLLFSMSTTALAKDKSDSWELRKSKIEKVMVDAYGKGTERDVQNELTKNGLELLGTTSQDVSGQIQPLSYGTFATITLSYYRDRFSGKYLVQGLWKWNTQNYDTDNSPYDAFGLQMSKLSDNTPATGQVYDSQGCAVYNTSGSIITGNMWASDIDLPNAGVAWTVADLLMSPSDYLGDKGQGWIWYSVPPSDPVALKAKYLHTYTGGTISGISIGFDGLTYILSQQTQNWTVPKVANIYSWPSN